MQSMLLVDLRRRAAQAGLNLFGVVDAERFDHCQPAERRLQRLHGGCGTALVLGSGGREFWTQFQAGAADPQQPIRDYSGSCLRELRALLASESLDARIVMPGIDRSVRFQQLGEAAGFGTISPVIGVLLHPDFGPWVSLHGALLVEGKPFGPVDDASVVDHFQPCCACPRPCVAACPAGAHDVRGPDMHVCAQHRHAGNCSDGCSVRRACPIGAEHRYAPAEEVQRQAHRRQAMQRWFGLGAWRFVPRFLRR
jgi:hypothetical protein